VFELCEARQVTLTFDLLIFKMEERVMSSMVNLSSNILLCLRNDILCVKYSITVRKL